MYGLSNQMWLLADATGWITLLVLLFSFVSWIIQKAAENKNVPPPKRNPGRQLPAPQAKELEDFLKRARQGDRAGRPHRDVVLQNDMLEVVEEPAPRPRPIQVQVPREPKRNKPKAKPKSQPQVFAPQRAAPANRGEPITAIQPLSRPLHSDINAPIGHNPLSEMRAHLTGYQETGQVDRQGAEYLPTLLEERRNQTGSKIDWSSGSAESVAARFEDGNAARVSIIEMFHNPQLLRQAIVVREILQRPRCLRRDE